MKEKKRNRSKIEKYVLRRVSWDKIIEGLKFGIQFAEDRYQKYVKLDGMDLNRYTNIVMSVLMEHIHEDFIDKITMEPMKFTETEQYLSELFSAQIFKSYLKMTEDY